MSHETWFLPIMDQIAGRHPFDFLDAMRTIHPWWHTRGSRYIGFLTFHKEVIVAFRRSLATVGSDGLFPPPLTTPIPVYDINRMDSINDLNLFSSEIEAWHNAVHVNPQFPPSFMDPERNIYFLQFWQFHHFIDQKFDLALRRAGYSSYDDFRIRGGGQHVTV